jgi:anti-sigma regulatory factor (Ser/Thr protein kinase)
MDHPSATGEPAADHIRSGRTCEVAVRTDDRIDHPVLVVRGVLSSAADDVAVRQALETQLLDRGRVVVDLSQVTVATDPVVGLFPAALAEAGGWPLARLVLARADVVTARILEAARIHLTVPVATTLDEATLLLDVRPPRVARDHRLPRHRTTPTLARLVIASACRDWELDDWLHDAAATVAVELVSNAVEHAGTGCLLQLTLDRRSLQIAVRDGRGVAEHDPRAGFAGDRGYGLPIVQGLSRGWGVTPHADGKTVWAMLDTGRDPLL